MLVIQSNTMLPISGPNSLTMLSSTFSILIRYNYSENTTA